MASGFQFNFKGIDELKSLFEKALASAAGKEKALLMNGIGRAVVEAAHDRFDGSKTSPYGDRWKDLKIATIRRKEAMGRNYGILRQSHALRNSVGYAVEGEKIIVGAGKDTGRTQEQIGNPRHYAAVHQFGWEKKNIPARPYLPTSGLGEDEKEVISFHIAAFLKRVFKKK